MILINIGCFKCTWTISTETSMIACPVEQLAGVMRSCKPQHCMKDFSSKCQRTWDEVWKGTFGVFRRVYVALSSSAAEIIASRSVGCIYAPLERSFAWLGLIFCQENSSKFQTNLIVASIQRVRSTNVHVEHLVWCGSREQEPLGGRFVNANLQNLRYSCKLVRIKQLIANSFSYTDSHRSSRWLVLGFSSQLNLIGDN